MNLEQLSKELSEIIPVLKASQDRLKGLEMTPEQIKDLGDRCKTLEGSFLDFGKQLADVKGFQTRDVSKGMSEDQKVDFVKFCIGVYKSQTNPEAVNMIKEVQAKYARKGMVEGTGTAGGYAVPTLFSKMIWNASEQASVILREATQMPLTKGFKLPITRLGTSVSVAWENESAALNETTPVLAQVDLIAKKLAGYTIISNELLEDEPMETMDEYGSRSITDWLVNLFAEAIGAEIDNQGFNGTGSPFTGVLNTVGVNQVLMNGGDHEFADVSADYLSKMISQLKSSQLAGSKFYLSPAVLHYVRTMKDSQQRPIWNMPDGNSPATIYGYPYVVVDKMPSVSASATKFLVFGNMKKYAIGTKGEISFQIGKELRMLNDETVLVAKKRIAMVAALPSAFSVLKTSPSVS